MLLILQKNCVIPSYAENIEFLITFINYLLFIVESGQIGGTFKENELLKKEVRKLEEENNLLKIKYEVILDMVNKGFNHRT